MPYLIDGHNLIPKIPGLSLQTIDDEVQLIQLLQDFCHRRGKRVDVYFDNAPAGQSGSRKFGMVTAHFVRQGTTADAAIRARLRILGQAARNWTVVTSDREIQAAAREVRSQIIPSEAFVHQFFESPPDDRVFLETDEKLSLGAEEVEEWLRIFGSDDSG